MLDYFVAVLPLVGVVLGYLLSQGTAYWKKRSLIKRYSVLLSFELTRLKEDTPDGLDGVIERYNQIIASAHRQSTGITIPASQNPSDFLKRWSFRNKYVLLRNNLDKISLFKEDTIKSILRIYSYMEDFEEFRQISISDPQSLERIGMGSLELLLVGNLQKAQAEIPIALTLLASE